MEVGVFFISQRYFLYLFTISIFCTMSTYAELEVQKKSHVYRRSRTKTACIQDSCSRACQKLGYAGSRVSEEILGIHRNIFDWDTLKLFVGIFPPYVASRMVDTRLQNSFYDRTCHKNYCWFPKWCEYLGEWSIALPIILLGSQSFLSKEEEWRETALTFLIGMPFVIFGKKLIKKIPFEGGYRPWNERFSSEKRSHGGFPSGHAAEASYMAMVYGLRYGPKLGLPLGLLTGAISVTFLTGNRHYLSQLVAGVGWGAMYALAAHKFIDKKLSKTTSFNMCFDEYGYPTFRLCWDF